MNSKNIPTALIITGPTASGKTHLSEILIKNISAHVINADVGQFYKPLTIGTAKPDLTKISYPTHCFDIADKPVDITVVDYRSRVVNIVDNLSQKGICPIIVGGSLFYIKSLFFPPQEHAHNVKIKKIREGAPSDLWQQLCAIDPVRAQEINYNDVYRINRALDIWEQTGVVPSLHKPRFDLPFRAVIFFVCPPKKLLDEKIKVRTQQMMSEGGWIAEARSLRGTAWEPFLLKKGLIGYPEIFAWLADGEQKETLPALIQKIQISTMQYAKRQITFWNSFRKQVEKEASSDVKIIVLEEASFDAYDVTRILSLLQNFLMISP